MLVVASLCVLVCALGGGLAPAGAVAAQFGGAGDEAGQLSGAMGLGLDQETGDVYTGELYDERVSKFDGAGSFLFAWGWKVDEASPAEELQTCSTATGCMKGKGGSSAGEFADACGAEGVAVDNDPLSSSYKDVYVVDFCGHRVQKFDSSGKFLLTFGGHVNETTNGDECVAGEACTSGSEGSGDGEFEWAFEHSYIAVGPGGAVYVGDKARVQVFEPSGVWRENVSLAGLSSSAKVTALAVNSAGDIFLADEGVAGVHEFEPDGIEKGTLFDATSSSVEAIASNEAGDLFVADGTGGFHIAEYDSSGVQLAAFGENTASSTYGIVFSDSLDELYVSEITSVWALTPPPPGPVIGSGSQKATAELRGAATLEGMVDPEGNATTVHFEYVDEKHFEESGYANATSTASQALSSGFGEEHVEIHLPAKTLVPGTTYHWRMVAVDSSNRTSTGPGQSLEETPAALIEGPWASNVAGSSATLSAKINPLGANTSYRLEYGTDTSYGHVSTGNVGEGMGYVTIDYHIQELQSHATYHYRLVTTSEVGAVETLDRSFVTQVVSEELTLPDGRAWELVSPPNKKAADISPLGPFLTQAASDGSGITYGAVEPIGEGVVGHIYNAQILSMRVAGVWRTQDVDGRAGLPPEGDSTASLLQSEEAWPLFSPNLSVGLLEPGLAGSTPQTAEVTERTLYLRDNTNGEFTPLENHSDVPAGLRFSDKEMFYFTSTPDLSNIVFGTQFALTHEAVERQAACEACLESLNLYEWHMGQLQLINVLPDGTSRPGAQLGNYEGRIGYPAQGQASAITNDGRWVVWQYGDLSEGEKISLYARDMVDKRTVRLGGFNARFETMSSDGSKIFFVETDKGLGGDLYVFEPETGKQIDLTANHDPSEGNAGVQNAVMGTSEDGSYVYFVATGVLASGGIKGADNLYLSHDGSSGWTTTFIAALSQEDEHTWGGDDHYIGKPPIITYMWMVDSEVSPNGRYLAFMSNSPLTGYDNRDAVTGQRDEEVFLYDAASNRLVCASCNPTGARPVGVLDHGIEDQLFMDSQQAWRAAASGSDHTLAGSLVGWDNSGNRATHHPRYVFDNGRLLFNSPDALVPQDTNGLADAYEYEPAGVGSCTSESASFSETSGGCLGLISSGQSSAESVFMDASETGDDAFFITSTKLVSEDYDDAYDMYDAHVCTTVVPCRTEPVSPPECTSGDSCKAGPSPQPTIFGATPSATFNGVGNITPSVSGVTTKSLTRAQELAQALKACRKKKDRKKRTTCERQARGRYGTKSARKVKATKRGNR